MLALEHEVGGAVSRGERCRLVILETVTPKTALLPNIKVAATMRRYWVRARSFTDLLLLIK
jgi:hypothetical protein